MPQKIPCACSGRVQFNNFKKVKEIDIEGSWKELSKFPPELTFIDYLLKLILNDIKEILNYCQKSKRITKKSTAQLRHLLKN